LELVGAGKPSQRGGAGYWQVTAKLVLQFLWHLRWLREELGERFLAGVVLHTGPRIYELDEKIVAAPIAVLWG
jgi:hypothetical protein